MAHEEMRRGELRSNRVRELRSGMLRDRNEVGSVVKQRSASTSCASPRLNPLQRADGRNRPEAGIPGRFPVPNECAKTRHGSGGKPARASADWLESTPGAAIDAPRYVRCLIGVGSSGYRSKCTTVIASPGKRSKQGLNEQGRKEQPDAPTALFGAVCLPIDR